MQDDMIQVGSILKAARESKGITQAALAEATGTVERTIMDIENAKRQPSFENLYKIVNVLDLPSDHIFRPEKVGYTLEQEQVMRAVQACDEQVQAMYIEIGWALVRVSESEKGAKK